MKTNSLSKTRISRIREQGYQSQTDEEINELAFGNRFAYQACLSFFIVGVLLANIPVLLFIFIIAFMGVVLPFHPFDYFYNNLLSKRLNKPRLPRRSAQLKFACTIATLFIGGTIYLFSQELMLAGYILGGSLIGVGLLVSTIDFCIPSIVFNRLFQKKEGPIIKSTSQNI